MLVSWDQNGGVVHRGGGPPKRRPDGGPAWHPGTMSSPSPLSLGLFVVGYPVSVVVITRFVPVVRQRRVKWFAAHQLGVAAVVAGWAVERNWPSVAANGAWLAAAAAWWVHAGRKR